MVNHTERVGLRFARQNRMYCVIEGHSHINEVQTITQVFYPNEKFTVIHKDEITGCEGIVVSSGVYQENAETVCKAEVYENGTVTNESSVAGREPENGVKLAIYNALSEKTGRIPPWGILTGIRPSKIVRKLKKEGMSTDDIAEYMHESYRVGYDKIQLCQDVADAEEKILMVNKRNDAALYIGIPFCPSRCLYCSFTSYDMTLVKRKSATADEYLAALFREIDFVSGYMEKKYLDSVYIGGGTPTALNTEQLRSLLEKIRRSFNISNVREYTVEAGRADTVTAEKLEIIKESGATRISINPQTMNDATLERIGRKHSTNDFLAAYRLAEKCGFDNINTDIIIGLPGETPEDVEYTMRELVKLNPASITVHTLAVKRASRLKENLVEFSLNDADETEKMLDITKRYAMQAGLHSYYMYRQKNSSGNFENVGYCRDGCECIYNVQIMEEEQEIIALGAGAVTKTVEFLENGETRIERCFNVKNYEEYINRIDEMIDRKKVLLKC